MEPAVVSTPFDQHPSDGRARYVRDLRSSLERERLRKEPSQKMLLSVDMPQSDLTKQEAKNAFQALEASVEWLDSEVFAVQAHLLLLLNSHAALQSRLSSLPQGAAARQRCLLLTDLDGVTRDELVWTRQLLKHRREENKEWNRHASATEEIFNRYFSGESLAPETDFSPNPLDAPVALMRSTSQPTPARRCGNSLHSRPSRELSNEHLRAEGGGGVAGGGTAVNQPVIVLPCRRKDVSLLVNDSLSKRSGSLSITVLEFLDKDLGLEEGEAGWKMDSPWSSLKTGEYGEEEERGGEEKEEVGAEAEVEQGRKKRVEWQAEATGHWEGPPVNDSWHGARGAGDEEPSPMKSSSADFGVSPGGNGPGRQMVWPVDSSSPMGVKRRSLGGKPPGEGVWVQGGVGTTEQESGMEVAGPKTVAVLSCLTRRNTDPSVDGRGGEGGATGAGFRKLFVKSALSTLSFDWSDLKRAASRITPASSSTCPSPLPSLSPNQLSEQILRCTASTFLRIVSGEVPLTPTTPAAGPSGSPTPTPIGAKGGPPTTTTREATPSFPPAWSGQGPPPWSAPASDRDSAGGKNPPTPLPHSAVGSRLQSSLSVVIPPSAYPPLVPLSRAASVGEGVEGGGAESVGGLGGSGTGNTAAKAGVRGMLDRMGLGHRGDRGGSRQSVPVDIITEGDEGAEEEMAVVFQPYGVGPGHPSPEDCCFTHMGELETMPLKGPTDAVEKATAMQYSALIEALREVDPTVLSDDERLAFWINLYNALVLWAHAKHGPPPTMGKWMQRLTSACYTVGGVAISAMEIEHCLLRARSHRSSIARNLKMKLFEEGDPRSRWTCVQPEPSVSFALAPGTRSAPPLRVYSSDGVREELEVAKSLYIRAALTFNADEKVVLPKLLDWYGQDFAVDEATLIEWVARQLPSKEQNFLRANHEKITAQIQTGSIDVKPYNWSFRYLFDLNSLSPPCAFKIHGRN